MIIFSIILFPAAAVWFSVKPGQSLGKGAFPDYFFLFFLNGIAAVLPALVILFFFKSFISKTNSHINIYLYNYINDFLFCHIIALAGHKYFFRNVYHVNHIDKIKQSFLYFAGFFTAYTVIILVMKLDMPDPYMVFILPSAWLALSAYSVLFLTLQEDESGITRTLHIAMLFASPVIIAFIPFFYYINMVVISIILLLLLISGGGYLLLKEAGEYFR